MIDTKIIQDSINSVTNARLITIKVTFPRFINAEVLRHRSLSFSSASSRAIPFKKIVKMIQDDPALPMFWGKTKSGMQAVEEIENKEYAKDRWLDIQNSVIDQAIQLFDETKLHKQIINRLLEPFQNITLIISGTDWDNFFALRAHPDAQPEFRMLAEQMLEAFNRSTPNIIKPISYKDIENVDFNTEKANQYYNMLSRWHLPFFENMPSGFLPSDGSEIKIVVARCARGSYLNFNNAIEPEKDIALFNSLQQSGHWSPFEHVAIATHGEEGKFSNYAPGWVQLRKLFPNENRVDDRLKKYKVINENLIKL